MKKLCICSSSKIDWSLGNSCQTPVLCILIHASKGNMYWKLMAEHSEKPFSTLETRSRTSSFQSHASRRDREFLPFSLMLRDEIENFCLSVSCFETRMRIWSYNLMFRDESEIFSHQSRASRREREFLLSVSCIETRTRIFTFSLILRDENFCLNSCTSRREREQCWGMASLIFSPFNNWKEFRWMNLINTCRNISLHSEEILFNWQQEILYRFAIDWRCPFLDAIASPSTYPCQSVSGW